MTNLYPLALQTKEGMAQRVEVNYYSGNCHESITGQDKIKSNFKIMLDMFLRRSGVGGCSDAASAQLCKAENIKIKCGKIQANGRKRSTQVYQYLYISIYYLFCASE